MAAVCIPPIILSLFAASQCERFALDLVVVCMLIIVGTTVARKVLLQAPTPVGYSRLGDENASALVEIAVWNSLPSNTDGIASNNDDIDSNNDGVASNNNDKIIVDEQPDSPARKRRLQKGEDGSSHSSMATLPVSPVQSPTHEMPSGV